MIKLTRFVFLLLCFFYGCSINRDQRHISKKQDPCNQCIEYFVTIPISEFSSAQLPLLNIEIEGQQLLVQLDLGFRGHIAIEKTVLDSIDAKTLIGEKLTYGIRSKKYREKSYRIPKIKIGSMNFSPPTVQEENPEFHKDALLVANSELESSIKVGRLGWELFQNSNLLIDISHSQIAFCDSFETLTTQGYQNKSFVQVPLLLDRGLAEFDAETPDGGLRCVLDTGATLSILNNDIGEEKPLDDLTWNADNIIEYPSLKINGEDFGPITLHPLPIRIPIRIEAILGMDFFKNHIIFLDFRNKYVYFSKNKENI